MSKAIDITGQKFGKLTAIERAGYKGHELAWKFKCICGNEIVASGTAVKRGRIQSCGCLRIRDLSGQKFGYLTVKEYIETKNNKAIWRCKCDCGNEIAVIGVSLTTGNTTSCGCMSSRHKSKAIDLIGRRFERLVVIERMEDHITISGNKYPKWKCQCDCGKITIVSSRSLLSGTTKSCGCYNREMLCRKGKNIKHGCEGTRLYKIHQGIKNRCNNSKMNNYSDYGGRGIKMCDEWQGDNGFVVFREWALSHGYQDNLSIDRMDNDKGYFPENCRWATNVEQGNNKRNNIHLEMNGERHTITEWSEIVGIKRKIIYQRHRKGWSDIDALTRPVRIKPRTK